MKVKVFVLLLLGITSLELLAQGVSIEECYSLARENYPAIKRYALIEKSKDYSLKNARAAYYPQFGLSAKATIQTEVIELPISLPGLNIPSLSKDQYQVAVELNQTIWDGGVSRAAKRTLNASSDLEKEGLNVDMYALNGRVNDLYFGILMLDEQSAQIDVLDAELARNLEKVKSYVSAGVANDADVDAVRVEILGNKQRRVGVVSSRTAYAKMLSLLVGREVGQLQRPRVAAIDTALNKRPELEFFDAQQALFEVQKSSIRAQNLPKFGAFVQGAYGNPGLNMLKPGFTPYAIGGVRLSWNFGGYYTQKHDIAKLDVQKQSTSTDRETFLFNVGISVEQSVAEIERLRSQMQDDDDIIRLRGNIKRSAEAKVAQGTMSVTDMLSEVTAESSAVVDKQMHEVELLKAIYILKNQTNN